MAFNTLMRTYLDHRGPPGRYRPVPPTPVPLPRLWDQLDAVMHGDGRERY